ncbi:MAG: hypothetical protein N3G80_01095 [Candidatus Micrarchaeota archaeon]|nr:hypothetical protein [Candidatus Micrarchaeota archaeon]
MQSGCMKGQAASEYLVMIGFALAFIVPLALLFLSFSHSERGKNSISAAQVAASTIADEAGEIFLQGEGARKTIVVNYPDGITNAKLENGLVVLRIEADGRTMDIVASTFANVSGNLSGKRTGGLQKIKLVNMGDFVNVSYD